MIHPLRGRAVLGQSWSSLRYARAAARQQHGHASRLNQRQLQQQSTCIPASCRGAQACLSSLVGVGVLLFHASVHFHMKCCGK